MAPVSGFDPLFAALEQQFPNVVSLSIPDQVPQQQKRSFCRRLAGKMLGHRSVVVTPTGIAPSPWVGKRQEWAGLQILDHARNNPGAWIILSVGENQYGYVLSTAPVELRKNLVFVAHQPPAWYRLNWRDFRVFDHVGAVVCLSSNQADFFESVCECRVIRLHHGVCHHYFQPAGGDFTATNPPRLLFVGLWLRDFAVLEASMAELWRRCPELRLDCVVPNHGRNDPAVFRLARDARVHWHESLPPESLRALYQQALLLFLPLIDATANNAIVEAVACGLPVVTSDVGGVSEYLPAGGGTLCPAGDSGAHVSAVIDWLENPVRRFEAAKVLRVHAVERLDWNCIAVEFHDCLARLQELHVIEPESSRHSRSRPVS
jgi:glycosyltransferase involved in cell wall biosynthesis